MNWFGIAIIAIPCIVIIALTAETVHHSRQLRAQARAKARPPRARSIRATYGPGYHPVLNWDWDKTYEGWWDGGSGTALRLVLSPIFRRFGYHMERYAKAWQAIVLNMSRIDQGIDFSMSQTHTFEKPWI